MRLTNFVPTIFFFSTALAGIHSGYYSGYYKPVQTVTYYPQRTYNYQPYQPQYYYPSYLAYQQYQQPYYSSSYYGNYNNGYNGYSSYYQNTGYQRQQYNPWSFVRKTGHSDRYGGNAGYNWACFPNKC